MESLRVINELIFGKEFLRRVLLPEDIRKSHEIRAGIAALDGRGASVGDGGSRDSGPVFILSAGWGCGSTLLQRLVASSGEVAMWGEPFDHAAFIERLASGLRAVTRDWPPDRHFVEEGVTLKAISDKWIANLTPPVGAFKQAHRAFFEKWFAEPAELFGAKRWGLKEVRLSAGHASYLKWLFPTAKFLLIYRDIFNSYRSCKGEEWYMVWPHYRVNNIYAFAHHWRYLLEGFLEQRETLDAMLIRYEDLVDGTLSIPTISEYLGTAAFDEAVLGKRIGARGKDKRLTRWERWVLQGICGKLREAVGYR